MENQKRGTSKKTRAIVTVLFLVFLFPVGLILMWAWSKWQTWVKVLVTFLVLFTAFIITPVVLAVALVAINPKARMDKARCAEECETVTANNALCIQDCIGKLQAPTSSLAE